MTRNAATVVDDLRLLLHPADESDVPVPGFPTGQALVAWAQEQPRAETIDALVDVLRRDGFPQQYAAMSVLRELGVAVRGLRHGKKFRWEVVGPSGDPMVIDPEHEPSESLATPLDV